MFQLWVFFFSINHLCIRILNYNTVSFIILVLNDKPGRIIALKD